MKDTVIVATKDKYTLEKLEWLLHPYFSHIVSEEAKTEQTTFERAVEISKQHNTFAAAIENDESLVIAKNGHLIFTAEIENDENIGKDEKWNRIKSMLDWFVGEK